MSPDCKSFSAQVAHLALGKLPKKLLAAIREQPSQVTHPPAVRIYQLDR
jgi:hypothetical protein